MKKIYPSILTLAIIASFGVANSAYAAESTKSAQPQRRPDQQFSSTTPMEPRGEAGSTTPKFMNKGEGKGPTGSSTPEFGKGQNEDRQKPPEATSTETSSTTPGFFGKVGHFFSNLFGGGDKNNENNNQKQNIEQNQNRQRGLIGEITDIDDDTITMTSKFGTSTTEEKTFTVDASNAEIKIDNATSTISDLSDGDTILVEGKIDGTTITATMIRKGDIIEDGGLPLENATSSSPEKQDNPGFFKKIGNFFSNIF